MQARIRRFRCLECGLRGDGMDKIEGFWMPKKRRKGKGTATMVCSECGNLVFGRTVIEIINRYDRCPWCNTPMNMMPYAEQDR